MSWSPAPAGPGCRRPLNEPVVSGARDGAKLDVEAAAHLDGVTQRGGHLRAIIRVHPRGQLVERGAVDAGGHRLEHVPVSSLPRRRTCATLRKQGVHVREGRD